MTADSLTPGAEDRVSNVLKWVLLAVAVGSFALFAWATLLTYERAPPQPERYVTADGKLVMSGADIIAGKGGFQKADLMDYGSLYGMGSYFGQDYTAFALMRLANLTEDAIAQQQFGKPYDALAAGDQAAARDAMRRDLQGVDLTRSAVTLSDALAGAINTVRDQMADNLSKVDLAIGWTPAYSLGETERRQTADFIIYSALTTVARRPNVNWSWTENWPFEPEVGNTPTTNTFVWTCKVDPRSGTAWIGLLVGRAQLRRISSAGSLVDETMAIGRILRQRGTTVGAAHSMPTWTHG